jgi:uncharacterized protein YfbU (UPF0304 family)
MTDKTFQTLKGNLEFAIKYKNGECYRMAMDQIAKGTEELTEEQSAQIIELIEKFKNITPQNSQIATTGASNEDTGFQVDCENCSS